MYIHTHTEMMQDSFITHMSNHMYDILSVVQDDL